MTMHNYYQLAWLDQLVQ